MAINLRGKKTSLDESASIYKKREDEIPDKDRLSAMTARQKWSYFATYYLPKLIAVLLILLVVGYILWADVFGRVNILFRCAVLNDVTTDVELNELSVRFTESQGLNPDKDAPLFTTFFTNNELAKKNGANAISDQTDLTSRVVADALTCIIASPDDVKNYMQKGFLLPLEDIFTPEELSVFGDKHLVYGKSEKDTREHIYGMDISDSKRWESIFVIAPSQVEHPTYYILKRAKKEDIEYAKRMLIYLYEND